MDLNLKEFVETYPDELERVAAEAGTKVVYLKQIARGHRRPSPDLARAIERATLFLVSRHRLRPDIFPREPWCQCPACVRQRDEAAA